MGRLRLPSAFAICTALIGAGTLAAAHARLGAPVEAGQISAAIAIDPAGGARHGPAVPAPGRTAPTVIERSANGMFYAHVEVNGRPTRFLVDTGASLIVLPRDDAAALGVDLAQARAERSVRTAAGDAPVAIVRLASVRLAGRELTDIEAAVMNEGVGTPLLGQSALAHLDLLAIRGDRMVLN